MALHDPVPAAHHAAWYEADTRPESHFGPPTSQELWSCDPMSPDETSDRLVTTSTRRLLRLAIAAADTASRFAREDIPHDPVAWMITPRALFAGHTAMEAVQELDGFRRSVVLHGLGMGLDAAPSDVDELLADDHDEDDRIDETVDRGRDGEDDASSIRLPRPRLLSCWIDLERSGERLFAFCAIVTDRPADLVERIVVRYGRDAAEVAEIENGYDHTTPFANAMISDALGDTLALAAAEPESPFAKGLDVVVEQRFLA